VIPREAIVRRALELGVPDSGLISDIRAMDGAYLDWVRERQQAEEEARKREAERERKHGQHGGARRQRR
jgi:hypothetical protein